ncbi:flagellar hook-length control protein FliK [Iodobacter ciconiae]|uniref:Flagellar hook-length control protein FliK n=1 Tax=Iodobacter ciconiae TaxID=2496266 RepID=A0A3S8ZWS0_9NEIS|nr:flagellar hook-length control protein FliK [Iodobacter ciconiae]AZN37933.1 flagellar hook-length control protein FliK [Iodobacter ciconiae]
MASNLTVTASAQMSRSAESKSSASMGADAAAQPFAKVLEREVSARQEGAPADQDDKKAVQEEHHSESEAKQAAVNVPLVSPWLAMLQAQVVVQNAPVLEDAQAELKTQVNEVDLNKLGQSLLAKGDGKDGAPLPIIDESGLSINNPGGQDAAKFASLRQKPAAGHGEFTAHVEEFSLAAAKENAILPKIDAAPHIALRTPLVVEAKPGMIQHTVAEPVGSSRWGDAVAQRVSMMLQDQHQQIDMQLNPPHLGPMEVRLTMSGEQASVVFSSQHASVREALIAATPRLTMLLADQGIQLSNVQVASDSLNQHTQQQAQQQASSQYMDQQRQSRSQQFFADLPNTYAEGQPRVMTDMALPVARSGLNLYV